MLPETTIERSFPGYAAYNGRGRAEFYQPAGAVEGPVSARFDEDGNSTITMTVETVEPPQFDLMEVLTRPRNGCTSLTVASPEGVFTAKEGIHYGFSLGAGPTTVTFHPLRSRFDSATTDARYWLLPLSNFVSRFPAYDIDLQAHPLRLHLPETQIDSGAYYSDRVIIFDSGGQLGYIQPLLNYESRVDDLQEGRERHRVTALMIENVGSNPVGETEWESWFPFDFFRLMSLATGVSVGAPWIEFRDASGHLVDCNKEIASGSSI